MGKELETEEFSGSTSIRVSALMKKVTRPENGDTYLRTTTMIELTIPFSSKYILHLFVPLSYLDLGGSIISPNHLTFRGDRTLNARVDSNEYGLLGA